eukprot:1014677_1
MLIQEIAEKIVVWLIDEYRTARAFEYDTGTWNAKKEFTLDQEYHSYALTPNGLFLVGFKPQYKEESRLKIDDTRQAISKELQNAKYHLKEMAIPLEEMRDDSQIVFNFNDEKEVMWKLIISITKRNDGLNALSEMKLQNADDDKLSIVIRDENEINQILIKLKLSTIKVRKRSQTPTGRIQLHAFILKEPFKKLEYKLNKTSMTGYEEFECEKKDASGSASVVDNVLLPKTFLSNQIGLRQNRLKI